MSLPQLSPALADWKRLRGLLARAVLDGAPSDRIDELRRAFRAARAAQNLRDLLAGDLPPTAAMRAELAAILTGGDADAA